MVLPPTPKGLSRTPTLAWHSNLDLMATAAGQHQQLPHLSPPPTGGKGAATTTTTNTHTSTNSTDSSGANTMVLCQAEKETQATEKMGQGKAEGGDDKAGYGEAVQV